MPNLTIYVPQDIADELGTLKIPVSRACQGALRRQIRLAKRRQAGERMITAQDAAAAKRAKQRDHSA